MKRASLTLLLLILLAAVVGPGLFGLSPSRIDVQEILQAPSWRHPLGTDALGRDMLVRVWAATRTTVFVSLCATLLGTALGATVGLWAGTVGGRVGSVLARFTEAVLAVPKIPLLLLAASVDVYALAPEAPPELLAALRLAFIMALLGWMNTARVLRVTAARLSQAPFVVAAQLLGRTPGQRLREHVWPHARSTWAAMATLELGDSVLVESALSFLGLGIPPPWPSWGVLLHDALEHPDCPWLFVAPGALTALSIGALHIAAEAYTRQSFEV